MAGLPKRNYGPSGDKLHADARRAFAGVEGQIDTFAPDDAAAWAAPAPTSLREAVNRIAAAIHALHPGNEP